MLLHWFINRATRTRRLNPTFAFYQPETICMVIESRGLTTPILVLVLIWVRPWTGSQLPAWRQWNERKETKFLFDLPQCLSTNLALTPTVCRKPVLIRIAKAEFASCEEIGQEQEFQSFSISLSCLRENHRIWLETYVLRSNGSRAHILLRLGRSAVFLQLRWVVARIFSGVPEQSSGLLLADCGQEPKPRRRLLLAQDESCPVQVSGHLSCVLWHDNWWWRLDSYCKNHRRLQLDLSGEKGSSMPWIQRSQRACKLLA